MTRFTNCLFSCAVALSATFAMAGPLDPLAIDTNTVGGIWHSSTAYTAYFDYPGTSFPSGLTGYIDWAVYAPGQFPGGFSGSYPANEFVYAYQAHVDASATLPLTFVGVTLETTANNIGTFSGNGGFGNVSGDPSIFSQIVPNSEASWTFQEIQPGGASTGLVFTSPFGPKLLDGRVLDGASTGAVIPLPTPDPQYIPEPGTLTLASLGLAFFGLRWFRRRRGSPMSS